MTYEEAEDERWREAMQKIIEASDAQQNALPFTAETFKAAFQKLIDRRPKSTPREDGTVYGAECEDSGLVDCSGEDHRGGSGFTSCPYEGEPWHVKR